MQRLVPTALLLAALIAAACGAGSNKKPATPTDTPTSEVAATPAPTNTQTRSSQTATAAANRAVRGGSGGSGGAAGATNTPAQPGAAGGRGVSGLFSTLFGSALDDGTDDETEPPPASDGTITRFLPGPEDLPAGYTSVSDATFRVPDGISTTGGIDIAMRGFKSDDPSAGFSVLAAMVLKPDDLQSLGATIPRPGTVDEQALVDAIRAQAGGDLDNATIDIQLLDLAGVGEDGGGIQVTLSDSSVADPAAAVGVAMRMYLFSRGQYAGMVMRLVLGQALPGDADDLAVARLIDRNLQQ